MHDDELWFEALQQNLWVQNGVLSVRQLDFSGIARAFPGGVEKGCPGERSRQDSRTSGTRPSARLSLVGLRPRRARLRFTEQETV